MQFGTHTKGKIERWFRTLRQQFLDPLDTTHLSLSHLNQRLQQFVEGQYHQRPHTALDALTPMERYLKDQQALRFVESEQLERIFLHEAARRVNRDATISLQNCVFEVPQAYIGRQVKVLYRPDDLTHAQVQAAEHMDWVNVYPVRSVDNSQIPRKQNRREPILYAGLYRQEED